MKKYLILALILAFASCAEEATDDDNNDATEKQWELVADAVSDTAGDYPQIVVDSEGNPYVVYKNATAYPVLKKYNGTTWESLADIEETTYSSSIGLAIDADDNVYIAYTTTTNTLAVKKYTDSWEDISPPNSSTKDISPETSSGDISIATDANSNIYVAYQGSSSGKAKKYNGTTWSDLDTAFDDTDTDYWDIEIKIDSNNVPYLMYANHTRLYIKKYDGTNWNNLGSEDFSTYNSPSARFTLNSDNNPVIAISHLEASTTHEVVVIEFNGTTFEKIGDDITDGEPSSASIALDSNNVPYLVVQDKENSFKASAMVFTDGAWAFIERELSTGQASDKMSFIITADDEGYLAFSDNGQSDKAIVMSYK